MSEEQKLKEMGNAIMFGIDPLESIVINKANLLHIAETGKLNGSLLNDLRTILQFRDSRIKELEDQNTILTNTVKWRGDKISSLESENRRLLEFRNRIIQATESQETNSDRYELIEGIVINFMNP